MAELIPPDLLSKKARGERRIKMPRVDRVAEAIRKEASTIIHDEIKDPRLGFVTITRVELSEDLRNAKIFFSVLGNDEAYAKTSEALDSALGFIRKLISERINLRFSPEIIFRPDRSGEYSVRIEEVLNEIHQKEEQEQKERQKNEPKKRGRVRKKTK
jgi:ribosome-binding factor A